MAFLWSVVILMAVALAAELFALVGVVLVGIRVARRALAWKEELAGKFDPSIRLAKELRRSLPPYLESLRRDSREIGALLAVRFRAVQDTYSDAKRRAQRIRFRLNSESVQTIEQLQQDRQILQRDVLKPARTVSRLVHGLGAALWLLRKVA